MPSGRCLPGTWAPPGSSHWVACQGLWGPGAGPVAGRPAPGRKGERARLGCFPHSPWTLREELSRAWVCHVSDSGDVMGDTGQEQGTGSFPFLSQFFAPIFHGLPPRSRSPSSPSPQQWKKPIIDTAVGGQLCKSLTFGALEGVLRFIFTQAPAPHSSCPPRGFLPTSSKRDGSSGRTKYRCLSQF